MAGPLYLCRQESIFVLKRMDARLREHDSCAFFTNREGKEIVLALFGRRAMAESVGGDHQPLDVQT